MNRAKLLICFSLAVQLGAGGGVLAQGAPPDIRPLAQSNFVLEQPLPELLPFGRAPLGDMVLMSVPANRAALEQVNLAVEKWAIPGNTLFAIDGGVSRVFQLVAGDAHVIIDGVDTWVKQGDTFVVSRFQQASIQTADDTAVFDVTALKVDELPPLNR